MKRALFVVAVAMTSACSFAADWGLKPGNVELKSAGPLAMGPDGILFIGDTKAATVFAVQPKMRAQSGSAFEIADLDAALNETFGGSVRVNDLAAHAESGTVYLSLTVGDSAQIATIDSSGTIAALSLKDLPASQVQLSDVPEDKVVGQGRRARNLRNDAITDIAFYEDRLLISGLKTVGAASSVREIVFPFEKSDRGIGVQIFHGAHGKEEDYAAMRTFVPLQVDGEPMILGAYVCTPLVSIPMKDLQAAADTVKAKTVAELGNWNRPLDMISYEKTGEEFLLLSNSARGVMKIPTAGLRAIPGLTKRVSRGGTAGQSYETVKALEGTVQLDRYSDSQAVIMMKHDNKTTLKVVDLP